MKQAKGFTLVELMIVVAIIAILASIAIPSYSDYVTRSKIAEATSSLAAMRVRMEQYYQDTRLYLNAGVCGTIGAAPAATANFTYACAATDLPAPTYTITATGRGGMTGFSYDIDHQNAKTSTLTGPALAAGWTAHTPNNCWVTNVGGKC